MEFNCPNCHTLLSAEEPILTNCPGRCPVCGFWIEIVKAEDYKPTPEFTGVMMFNDKERPN